jgi:hypothetical protein
MRSLSVLVPLLLLGTPVAASSMPSLFSQTFYLFQGDQWIFACDFTPSRLKECNAHKDFGRVRVGLDDEGGINVKISVSGGCPASGPGTVDTAKSTERDGRDFLDPQQVWQVAMDRVNARRAACRLPRLSKRDEESIQFASVLFVQVMM